jgi:hypothetical protein
MRSRPPASRDRVVTTYSNTKYSNTKYSNTKYSNTKRLLWMVALSHFLRVACVSSAGAREPVRGW